MRPVITIAGLLILPAMLFGQTVTITSPLAQGTYMATVSPLEIRGTVNNSAGVNLVRIYSEKRKGWDACSGTAPWVCSVELTPGYQLIYVAAIGNGNVPGPPLPFAVSYSPTPTPSLATPPAVSITAPASDASVSGSNVALTATATASAGLTISSVQFKIDGTNIGSPVLASPYTVTLDATKWINGTHALTAVIIDSSGASVTSSAVPITVSNPAPVVTVTAPAANATVSGSVTVTATATAATGRLRKKGEVRQI